MEATISGRESVGFSGEKAREGGWGRNHSGHGNSPSRGAEDPATCGIFRVILTFRQKLV